MDYSNTWKKILAEGEEVKYEFSVGDRFLKINLFVWLFIGGVLLLAGGLGIIFILYAGFKYGFYLRRANAYALTNKRVLVHKGWLNSQLISIDYDKITDILVEEPFLDRVIYKTGNISFNTAGTAQHEVVLVKVQEPYEIKKKLEAFKTS